MKKTWFKQAEKLKEKVMKASDDADMAFEKRAINFLEKRGYIVTKTDS